MSTIGTPATACRPPLPHFARLRRLGCWPTTSARWRELLSAPLLIAAVAVFIVAVDNGPLWHAAWRATDNDDHRPAILSTIFALVFVTLTTVLSFAFRPKL